MINKIINNTKYKELMCTQIKDTINFLLEQNQEFAITANIDALKFLPKLPSVTHSTFAKFPLFILSNYTYTTIKIDEDYLYFEAGFGSENFGSIVQVPLYSIFQIIIDESILFINALATVDKFNEPSEEKSFNIFKKNLNNKNFI